MGIQFCTANVMENSVTCRIEAHQTKPTLTLQALYIRAPMVGLAKDTAYTSPFIPIDILDNEQVKTYWKKHTLSKIGVPFLSP